MSQPSPFARQSSFTDYQASFPSAPLLGTAVDAEFNALLVTLREVLANLALIQRDDGKLANSIVTLDTLSPAVMIALGAGVVWLPRGGWATATIYAVSDVIQSGTGSYVCAEAHTSSVFVDDVTAGRWVKLFDDAGTIPADGSVTPAKLAAGAVTTAAIGFTTLDLAGNIRGGGIQAGIAPLGSLLHAKLAAGEVIVRAERVTEAQGAVGFELIGADNNTWDITLPASDDRLTFAFNGVMAATLATNGVLEAVGTIRAIGDAVPATGSGVGLSFSTGTGLLTSFNYGLGTWLPLKLRAASIILQASAVDVLEVTATGFNVTGTAKRGGVELGWLDLPQNVQNGAYTFALGDRGKHILGTNVAGQTFIIPATATTAFPIGTVIAVVNNGALPISITPASGVLLRLANTVSTGNRSIAVCGMATLLKIASDTWYISGAGVS